MAPASRGESRHLDSDSPFGVGCFPPGVVAVPGGVGCFPLGVVAVPSATGTVALAIGVVALAVGVAAIATGAVPDSIQTVEPRKALLTETVEAHSGKVE